MVTKHARSNRVSNKVTNYSPKKINFKDRRVSSLTWFCYNLLKEKCEKKGTITASDVIALPSDWDTRIEILINLHLIDPIKVNLLSAKCLDLIVDHFAFLLSENKASRELMYKIAKKKKEKKSARKFVDQLEKCGKNIGKVINLCEVENATSTVPNLYRLMTTIIFLKTGDNLGENSSRLWKKMLHEISC